MTDLYVRITDDGRHQPYRLVNGIYKEHVGPSFATGREAIDFCKAQAGLPGRHPSPDLARVGISTESRDEVVVATEAPGGASSTSGPGIGIPPSMPGASPVTSVPTASAAPSAHRLLGSARDARPDSVSASDRSKPTLGLV